MDIRQTIINLSGTVGMLEAIEKNVPGMAEMARCNIITCHDAQDLLKRQQWISVKDRLPENAEHKGAYCPRYRVLTKWGESVGWYNPDKGCWYFILWYLDGECIDFEHGDRPEVAKERNGVSLVTHWMPMSEPPKEGEKK